MVFLLDLPIGEFFNQTTHMEVKIVASCMLLSTDGMTLVAVRLVVANLYAKYYLEIIILILKCMVIFANAFIPIVPY